MQCIIYQKRLQDLESIGVDNSSTSPMNPRRHVFTLSKRLPIHKTASSLPLSGPSSETSRALQPFSLMCELHQSISSGAVITLAPDRNSPLYLPSDCWFNDGPRLIGFSMKTQVFQELTELLLEFHVQVSDNKSAKGLLDHLMMKQTEYQELLERQFPMVFAESSSATTEEQMNTTSSVEATASDTEVKTHGFGKFTTIAMGLTKSFGKKMKQQALSAVAAAAATRMYVASWMTTSMPEVKFSHIIDRVGTCVAIALY